MTGDRRTMVLLAPPCAFRTGHLRLKWILFFILCATVSSSHNERFSRRILGSRVPSSQQLVPWSNKRANNKSVVQVVETKKDDSNQSDVIKFWPPWPFNLLSRPQRQAPDWDTGEESGQVAYRSSAQLFWIYFRHRARIGVRQVQQVASDLWFHLPPAAPPLILLAAIPRRVTAGEVSSRIPPLIGNAFARNLALGYLGVAIMSWSHSELQRKRRLVPLPLMDQYQDVQRAILPHFLPEQIPELLLEPAEEGEEEVVQTRTKPQQQRTEQDGEETEFPKGLSSVPPMLRRQLQNIYDVAPRPHTLRSTFREWGRMREARRMREERIRRHAIADELAALNLLKKNAERKTKRRNERDSKTVHKDSSSDDVVAPLGYALVTGASRGIGRALAVELARWEIPLILVARDIDRLAEVAEEIETCYGVKCFVLEADLSKPDAADNIHKTTSEAGLRVDILVNNAGICTTGLAVDMSSAQVRQMLQVNAMSVALLNHLYGHDMKNQGRGRILVVSSVVGCSPAGPHVATYGATKAFEKNLALSMGKELEPYGVGVTVLMPGAVKNTSFRSQSGSEDALCWNLPFYTRTAQTVAHQGVRAMLSGQTEVSPGWQNRAFVKLMTPMIPQRLTALIVETAWTPSKIKLFRSTSQKSNEDTQSAEVTAEAGSVQKSVSDMNVPDISKLFRAANPKFPPRMLILHEDKTSEEPETDDSSAENVSTTSEALSHPETPQVEKEPEVSEPHNPPTSESTGTTTGDKETVDDDTKDADPRSTEDSSTDQTGSHQEVTKSTPSVQDFKLDEDELTPSPGHAIVDSD